MTCWEIERADEGLAAASILSCSLVGDSSSDSFFLRRFFLSWTTHSKPSARHFVQGSPVSSTSQRTLRVRQQEHALEARLFFSLLGFAAEGDGDCSGEFGMPSCAVGGCMRFPMRLPITKKV